MEALTAVGVASNVVQFLELGISVVRLAFQITGSATGTTKHMTELEVVASDITKTLKAIKSDSHKAGNHPTDDILQGLVKRCLKLSEEIIDMINDLKVQHEGRLRIVEGIYKAGLTIYKRKDLERLSGQLLDLRTQVTSHLIVLIE